MAKNIYDNFGTDKTPYKMGVITKNKGIYDLQISKNKNDIFEIVKQSKNKKEVYDFAKKYNIKLYKDYREVYNS